MTTRFNNRHIRDNRGFTLIELVIVIVIAAVLAAVAAQKLAPIDTSIRIEDTMGEMDGLAVAIVGNPDLQNNGMRTDFGYVGDVGALPVNLDALLTNPGSYATWNGPYIQHSFVQAVDDIKKDAWGIDYAYSAGVTITSTGSGENIIRRLAASEGALLRNSLAGNIFDLDGSPPGDVYMDSLSVRLTVPDGAGGLTAKSAAVDAGGFFSFDSIPIGNHDLEIVYLPEGDTLRRFVSATPGSSPYGEYFLNSNIWFTCEGGTGIVKVPGSDTLYNDCHGFFFWIENTTGTVICVDSVTLSWPSTTAYYRYVKWGGANVVDRSNPKVASGETVALSGTQIIPDGQSLRVDFDFFKSNATGGSNVDMDNLTFTVDFSDGSTITVITGSCP